jgi:serine/threonine protein phosphatase PrpC
VVVLSARVAGASHKLKNAECQDNHKVAEFDGIVVLAAADGHGSEACKHSKIGSEIAVNVFHKVMRKFCMVYSREPETCRDYLTREGGRAVAQAIDREWKSQVLARFAGSDNPDNSDISDEREVCKSHGTTLLGLVLTPTFYFALQIGDGDILLLRAGEAVSVIEADKILGIETHSLSRTNSWEKALAVVADVPGAAAAFMLATDGFANSYGSESAFHRACLDYYAAISEHGAAAVQANLGQWLEETSENGSGDDITVLFAVV